MDIRPPENRSSWISLWNQLSRQLRRQLGERYALAGLSESRAAVLQSLARTSQALTQSELAQELSLSESNLCSLIERMRIEGLLERGRSPLDRRKSVLTLTASGRESCLDVEQIHAEFEADLLDSMPSEQRELISLTFSELSDSLRSQESSDQIRRRAA